MNQFHSRAHIATQCFHSAIFSKFTYKNKLHYKDFVLPESKSSPCSQEIISMLPGMVFTVAFSVIMEMESCRHFGIFLHTMACRKALFHHGKFKWRCPSEGFWSVSPRVKLIESWGRKREFCPWNNQGLLPTNNKETSFVSMFGGRVVPTCWP